MAKTKKVIPEFPKRVGAFCGGTQYEDGSIDIAPTYVDQFMDLSHRKQAVDMLLKSVTDHCVGLNRALSKDQGALWKRVCDNYGINLKTKKTLWAGGERITVTDRPPPDKETP